MAEYRFENGAIVTEGAVYEPIPYDVANRVASARFNGKGGVDYFAVADGALFSAPIRYMNLVYNGEIQSPLLSKRVCMLGRRQTVTVDLKTAALTVEQYLDEALCGVFSVYRLTVDRAEDTLDIGLNGDFFRDLAVQEARALEGADKGFDASGEIRYCPENGAVYFRLTAQAPVLYTVMAFGDEEQRAACRAADFSAVRAAALAAVQAVAVPENLSEEEKALFYSSFWCALENYKEKGAYKGFMAGCRYLSPMRTYYRDSYYTVLSMYHAHADKVKKQILTLARGIGADGTCPSAVKSDWSDWWGDHYDSPSFFAMMVYDYIRYTGELSLADMVVGERTVLEKAVQAVEHLARYADDTGLLYKAGRYNQRDWADEVNRYGYVTYDQVLYARALYSIAQIYRRKGNASEHRRWMSRFEAVKKAVNDWLWDEEKGYFVNFKNEDYVEDNCSIDTVLAAIFHIADEKRARRMLRRMEELLETPANGVEVPFGSMCVYPFYKKLDAARNKSTQCFDYHNGANWPYWSAMYALAKRQYGMEWRSLLTVPFSYNLQKGNYTPIEYFSPYCPDGSLLQAWSGVTAFVLDEAVSARFFEEEPEGL